MLSIESKEFIRLFNFLKRLEILSADEEFDRFYVWVQEVESYVKTYSEIH